VPKLSADDRLQRFLAIIPWVASRDGPTVEERRPDGSVVLEVQVTNREAFRSFVLGFLDHAEILGPPELRADMVDWLEDLVSTEGASVARAAPRADK
jgi:predicted DNA-binding transcriptional regulator YafY